MKFASLFIIMIDKLSTDNEIKNSNLICHSMNDFLYFSTKLAANLTKYKRSLLENFNNNSCNNYSLLHPMQVMGLTSIYLLGLNILCMQINCLYFVEKKVNVYLFVDSGVG